MHCYWLLTFWITFYWGSANVLACRISTSRHTTWFQCPWNIYTRSMTSYRRLMNVEATHVFTGKNVSKLRSTLWKKVFTSVILITCCYWDIAIKNFWEGGYFRNWLRLHENWSIWAVTVVEISWAFNGKYTWSKTF